MHWGWQHENIFRVWNPSQALERLGVWVGVGSAGLAPRDQALVLKRRPGPFWDHLADQKKTSGWWNFHHGWHCNCSNRMGTQGLQTFSLDFWGESGPQPHSYYRQRRGGKEGSCLWITLWKDMLWSILMDFTLLNTTGGGTYHFHFRDKELNSLWVTKLPSVSGLDLAGLKPTPFILTKRLL